MRAMVLAAELWSGHGYTTKERSKGIWEGERVMWAIDFSAELCWRTWLRKKLLSRGTRAMLYQAGDSAQSLRIGGYGGSDNDRHTHQKEKEK